MAVSRHVWNVASVGAMVNNIVVFGIVKVLTYVMSLIG